MRFIRLGSGIDTIKQVKDAKPLSKSIFLSATWGNVAPDECEQRKEGRLKCGSQARH
jgi:hypothetical protein